MTEPARSPIFDLGGKLALVVGASRGIGEACAVALAEAGADLALSGRSLPDLARTADQVRAKGRSVSCHEVNVRHVESIQRHVADVLDRRGPIDVLLYNAGTNANVSALDLDEQAWDVVLETNLKGAFFTAREVGRAMIERGAGGRIISIASTFSVVGYHNRAAYAASKGGLAQLTKVLAIEWAQHGINVNAVAPTATRTRMNEALFADPAWRADVLPRIPLGRFATPQDITGAVVFLASPASSMVTGHLLLVDGGYTAI